MYPYLKMLRGKRKVNILNQSTKVQSNHASRTLTADMMVALKDSALLPSFASLHDVSLLAGVNQKDGKRKGKLGTTKKPTPKKNSTMIAETENETLTDENKKAAIPIDEKKEETQVDEKKKDTPIKPVLKPERKLPKIRKNQFRSSLVNPMGTRVLVMDAEEAVNYPTRLNAGYCIEHSENSCGLLPALVITGYPGNGLSTLKKWLDRHPHLVHSNSADKLHFFSQVSTLTEDTFAHYVDTLPKISEQEIHTVANFEHSDNYFSSPTCAAMLSEVMPNLKIVIVIRDPIEQVYNSFQRECLQERLGFSPFLDGIVYCDGAKLDPSDVCVKVITDCTSEDFDKVLFGSKQSFRNKLLQSSAYETYLSKWKDYFPLSSLLILNHRDFATRTIFKTMRRVMRFLSLDDYAETPRIYLPKSISSRVEDQIKKFPMTEKARIFLEEYYAQL